MTQVQQEGDHAQNTNGGFGSDMSVSPASPTPQAYHETVDKLNPGGKYKLKVRADSNTGGSIEATRPYTGTHFMCGAIMCCACIYIIALLSFSFLQRDQICALSVVFLVCMLLYYSSLPSLFLE